jgi:hypothetical protein
MATCDILDNSETALELDEFAIKYFVCRAVL